MKTQISIFTIFILLNLNLYSQNTISSNVTHNSATISFPNPTGESLNINVFTQNVDDTIAFFEDFSKLPTIPYGKNFFNSRFALNLPTSYTSVSGCQGRNIYSNFGDTCNLYTNGEFITAPIDLSKSNGHYRITFYASNKYKNPVKFFIYQIDSLGDSTNISIISMPKNSSLNYSQVFSGGGRNNRIRIYSPSQNISIDNLSISYTFIEKIPIISSPLNTNNNSLNINSLSPNTKYYCFIEGRTDTISFKTLESIRFDSIIKTDPIGARFKFSSSDTVNNRKLILRKKSNHETIFAEDLFISEYTCANTYNKAIEIFNGTGLDICLKDYSIKFQINTPNNTVDYIEEFTEEDTIKSNTCIVLTGNLKALDTLHNAIFYQITSFYHTSITGNDAIAIMKDSNYIDIFGRLGDNINNANGWTWGSGSNTISTYRTTLRRKPNVNKGIKVNPLSGFATLGSEWTQIGDESIYTSPTFKDFGRHTMDNACGTFDSLAFSINLGLKDSVYEINNLEEGCLYEAYLVIGDNADSVVSNTIKFKTGFNSERIANGNWNDGNWSKGIPSVNDNAIINSGQTLSIPQGVDANCYNLIIRDSSNERKAEFINNGDLRVENKTIVEKYFKAYTSDNNGWNLVGLPINVSSSNQDTIGQSFFHTGENDDLYYWQEDFTNSDNNGRWINFKDIPDNTGEFFINSRGYLTAYENNTKLKFYGELNNEGSYSLLNNASLSSPYTQRGWHLCNNPYPFYITTSNLQRSNISLPSLLDPETSNYTALLEGESIPPFAGFMVQVANPANSLNITKDVNGAKTFNSTNLITLNVFSSNGYDKTRLILRDSATMGYDVEYDNRKLRGYSSSPEIYSIYNNEEYSVNVIPKIIDSLIMDIGFISKSDNNYIITLDISSGEEFDKIALFDKISNTELIDFKVDSSYSFYSSSENNADMFVLKIFKNLTSINEVEIEEEIYVKQNQDIITVISNSKIKALELTNIKGQTINKNSNSNSITIPSKGVYILRISTLNHIYNQKIIFL